MDLQAHKTARLSVLLSPDDKRSIERKAQGLNLSVGEYVRRASQSYDPALDDGSLEAMIELWHGEVIAMRDRLAATVARTEQRLAEIEALRRTSGIAA